MTRLHSLRILLLFVFILTVNVLVEAQPNIETLRWRYIGPVGNRVTSIVGVPGQPYIYYAGSASGGIFKTVDGGIPWSGACQEEARPADHIGQVHRVADHPVRSGSGHAAVGGDDAETATKRELGVDLEEHASNDD